MPRILDYTGQDVSRSVTVASIVAQKEADIPLTQVTAGTSEEAGAFAVECELIPERAMTEINRRTGMATISLGSSRHADVMFLFMSDICGESPRQPRHARAYGDLAALHAKVREARVDALSAYRDDVVAGRYPGESEVASIDRSEFDAFAQLIPAIDNSDKY